MPLYDNTSSVCGIVYDDTPFYFQKNLQGDIIEIVDKNAEVVAKYSYDAWGECTILQDSSNCHIASLNPYRYRGYYYDAEIGLYYLQSRYYDPSVGRFISADDVVITCLSDELNDINVYTYCKNNPIIFKDPYGNIAIVDDLVIAGVVLTAIVAIVLLIYISTPEFKSAWYDFCSSVAGALTRLWRWVNIGFMSIVRIVENSVEKCVEKTTDVIRRRRGDYYWIASSVSFKKRDVSRQTYFPCKPISFYNAKNYVKRGGNVFAASRSSAKRLAYAVGNGACPVGPEIHGGLGYFWHYHAHRHVGGHIFFIFWG